MGTRISRNTSQIFAPKPVLLYLPSLLPPVPSIIMSVEALKAQATYLMVEGCFEEAAAAWRGVLFRLLPTIVMHKDIRGISPAATTVARPPPPSSSSSFQALAVSSASSTLLGHNGDRDTAFSLFCHAIHYSRGCDREPAGEGSGAGLQGLEIGGDFMATAATAAFNLGLCWHILAIQGSRDNPVLLERALQYYLTTRQLLKMMQPSMDVDERRASRFHIVADDPVDDDGFRFFSLVLANNMGHIFQLRHDWASVRRCLKELHRLLPGPPGTAESLPTMQVVAVLSVEIVNSAATTTISSAEGNTAARLGISLRSEETEVVPCLPIALTAALHPSYQGLNIHAAAA
jgi:hypothetical protein